MQQALWIGPAPDTPLAYPQLILYQRSARLPGLALYSEPLASSSEPVDSIFPSTRHSTCPNAKKIKRPPSLVAPLSSSCLIQLKMLSESQRIAIAKSAMLISSIHPHVFFSHFGLRLTESSTIARHRAFFLYAFLSLSYYSRHRNVLDSPIESTWRS